MDIDQILNNTFDLIERGKLGKNIGLTTGLPKFESVTGGNQRGVYTLIFGGTGSGKSSYALYAHLYKPMMSMFGKSTFKTVLYSLEMSTEMVLTKLLSLYIYETFGEELSYKQILSKQEIIDDTKLNIVMSCKEWLKTVLENHLIIYDKGLNADIMYAHLSSVLNKLGTTSETDSQKFYTFNDPDQHVNVFIDHISLVRKSNGRSKKEEIDQVSNYLVTLRNRCKISPIVIMQSNRTGMSMDRRNAGMFEPQLEDIKDSGGPSEDAEVVVAVFYPHREKMVSYRDYPIAKVFTNKFRSLICLKNRTGEVDLSVGCSFFGSIGMFYELPVAKEITNYDYYTSLEGYKKLLNNTEITNLDGGQEDEKMKNDNEFIL